MLEIGYSPHEPLGIEIVLLHSLKGFGQGGGHLYIVCGENLYLLNHLIHRGYKLL